MYRKKSAFVIQLKLCPHHYIVVIVKIIFVSGYVVELKKISVFVIQLKLCLHHYIEVIVRIIFVSGYVVELKKISVFVILLKHPSKSIGSSRSSNNISFRYVTLLKKKFIV